MSNMYMIEYHNKNKECIQEEIKNTNSLYHRYKELSEQNLVDNIINFWRFENGLMNKMSHYEISRTLDKGKAPENGFIIEKETDEGVQYVADIGFNTGSLKYALYLSKEQAESLIAEYQDNYNDSNYKMSPITKCEHDKMVAQ